MVILVDDEDRENEGDLVMAAEFVSGASVNFMAVQARGLICLALEETAVDRLGLAQMVGDNRTERKTAFTISIEARTGVTTGISAFDRARTIQAATAPNARSADVVSPGHVFPLRARAGGVLARAGHTEGSIDLMRIAGLSPAAVICELMNDDGHMARLPDLRAFSERHDIPILTIAEIAHHRMANETLVDEIASARLPTIHAPDAFEVRAFRSRIDGLEHLALIRAPLHDAPLVRIHSECLTGDALGSLRCDCGEQLRSSQKRIGEDGGVLIYLRGQEGRGLGLANKIKTYALQDQGLDTVEANAALGFPADMRDYGVAAQILKMLGLSDVRLLSNNPAKAAGLRACGVTVREELALAALPNPHNTVYLNTKRDKLGHRLAHSH